MSKRFLASLAFLLCLRASLPATEIGSSDNERMLSNAGSKPKKINREQLIRDIDETMLIVEDLSRQMKLAPQAELEEVWASGLRDYKLDKGEVKDSRKACEKTLQAMDLEAGLGSAGTKDNASKAKELRSDARDLMRPHHKKQSEEYVRDLRNWLSISEGILRHANEAREEKK